MLEVLKARLVEIEKALMDAFAKVNILTGHKAEITNTIALLEKGADVVAAVDPKLAAPIAGAESVVAAVETAVDSSVAEPIAS